MQWLEAFPGESWQQRWQACPALAEPHEWMEEAKAWTLQNVGRRPTKADLTSGTLALLCADVVRPGLPWLAARRSRFLREAMAASRDPEGFATLEIVAGVDDWSSKVGFEARNQISMILAAKGGLVRDITVGDCLELRDAFDLVRGRNSGNRTLFYVWLQRMGIFPSDAPATLRQLESLAGQVSVERLVDRYGLKCPEIRDLIVAYLKERQPALDYGTLEEMSRALASNFWADLERNQPGIDSLHLAPKVASEWKERIKTKTARRKQPDGTIVEVKSVRASAGALLMQVRAFYLDLAEWAAEEPGRWGPWVAPCPIKPAEISTKKHEKRVKARTDQRTRERLPVLPVLVRAADQRLKDAKARLDAVRAAPAGSSFTVLSETYTKAIGSNRWRDPGKTTVVYDTDGERLDLGMAERRAFWAWASIEFLRHTGARVEEMLEASHHSIVQYTLPTTREIVPLLQIAPSKTDEERVLLVTPELADVLSAIVTRVRNSTGAIPLVAAYDQAEKTWNPPMPLLFQWNVSGQNVPVSVNTVRNAIYETLDSTGLSDASGNPLRYQPHDFRRIFVTDAIRSGLPPHIAMVICGHSNINTTMGYNTVYPADVIESHRAFIGRRRNLRPGEEYRMPTPEEWESFLGHFERRKLSLGTCGRAYNSPCVHEHACIRCSMLLADPHERPRLVDIRDNLIDRIAEAEREGWLGEIDGLGISLAATEEKLAQLDAQAARKGQAIEMGMPTFRQIAARSSTVATPQESS
ncbi:site-specific integrase [Streptomyces sp. H10-C2]|uniref:site-specific integrase n=1 Tax=unclassified Streptomyces TaxID=2593676 RepID=UPI0024BBA155|nr:MULTISPECIES: site-specific integrase [unclassified Streptomyces]MDJ0346179.1 site-specific integrase [Streptomyces sp. PH10-H1]MDJ0374834.1 site-specific integrase [Streptomyces sp. H10-C2]